MRRWQLLEGGEPRGMVGEKFGNANARFLIDLRAPKATSGED